MKRRLFLLITAILILKGFRPDAVYALENQKPESDIKIPILMYHHFTEGEPPSGREGEIISVKLYEDQMSYLKSKGFNTISAAELRDFLYYDAQLPENPIMITIDDGYESNYTLAFPILQQLNMKAIISVIVSSRGKKPGEFQHFTWEEAQIMLESGLVEIGSHTYNLHNYAIQPQADEAIPDYEDRIFHDFLIAKNGIQKNLSIDPFVFTYPYGMYNRYSQAIALELGFDIQFSVNAGVVTKDSNPLALERINVRGDESPQQVLSHIHKYMGIEESDEVQAPTAYAASPMEVYLKASKYKLLNKNDLYQLQNNITNYETQQFLLNRTKELENFEVMPAIVHNLERISPILERMTALDMSNTLLTYGEALNYLMLIGNIEGIKGYYPTDKLLTQVEFVDLLIKVIEN